MPQVPMFKRRKKQEEPMPRQAPETMPGDWVVLPYRMMEAARLSLYTIGSHPDLPEHVRWWVANWLAEYNSHLASYFQETYGPNIFEVLEKITNMVKAASEEKATTEAEETYEEWFNKWEEQVSGGNETEPPSSS